MKTLLRCALLLCVFTPAAFAQVKVESRPRLDVSFSVSSLGLGAQVAKPLPHRSDIRGGFNFYTYKNDLTDDGADYAATVHLKSVNLQFDKYLVAGLFVSGGALLWNGTDAEANVTVAGGQSFSLGNASYISNPSSPIHGDSTLNFRTVAPLLSLGYGNLTSKGHIAYTIEAGVAFHGTPQATLSLAGSACTPTGGPAPGGGTALVCQNAATDPIIQSNVAAQQQQINDDISNFKYYPILQFSIGYKF